MSSVKFDNRPWRIQIGEFLLYNWIPLLVFGIPTLVVAIAYVAFVLYFISRIYQEFVAWCTI